MNKYNYMEASAQTTHQVTSALALRCITRSLRLFCFLLFFLIAYNGIAQQQKDSSQSMTNHRNIIRYNLSGALLVGFDKYIVLGYERVLSPKKSISVNFGLASLPKFVNIETDSFNLQRKGERSGYNFSVDYRIYLARENKYPAPRGFYIGPYFSYNHFTSTHYWQYKNSTANKEIGSNSNFNINTIGFELGYQLLIGKRLTLDFVMVGPGFGFYNYKVSFVDNLDAARKQQILDGLEQWLTQKFPGMDIVLENEGFNTNGVLSKVAIGYRYMMQIGYNF